MELRIKKIHETRNCTVSRLFINGKPSVLILQDGHRDVKEYGDTRIPAGRYEIKLRKAGGFHQRYLAKYGASFHKGMLELQAVPNFTWILIHIGNTPEDTKGCLLTGTTSSNSNCFVGGSEKAYLELYPQVANAITAGQRVFITMDYA